MSSAMKYTLCVQILLLLSSKISVIAEDNTKNCKYFLAPAPRPEMGRGIYTGKHYEEDEHIDVYPSLLLPMSLDVPPLSYYTFGSDQDEDSLPEGEKHKALNMMAFGPQLLNHNSNPNVNK